VPSGERHARFTRHEPCARRVGGCAARRTCVSAFRRSPNLYEQGGSRCPTNSVPTSFRRSANRTSDAWPVFRIQRTRLRGGTYGRSEPTTPAPDDRLSRRTRSIRYGGSVLLVLIGIGCGALIRGSAGGTLATVFVGLGLVGVVSLVFYEVGLTEDRDREDIAARGRVADLDSPAGHGRSPARAGDEQGRRGPSPARAGDEQGRRGPSPARAGDDPDDEPSSASPPHEPQAGARPPRRPPRHHAPDRMRGRRRRLR
jgi:hypothetical protein